MNGNVLRTARRGVEEETGAGEDEYILLGAGGCKLDPLTTTTGKDDAMTVFEPYCMFQSLRGPRPLFAACFIGLVSETFTPRPDGSGEVKGFQWWGWRELHKELREHPKKFSPVHPVLMKVCRDILARKLNL